ncbi:acyltransferase [Myxosarcina sp. GI1(2024)]
MQAKNQVTSPWSRLKTEVITLALGWVPSIVGLGLRYLLYPVIFHKMGKSVKIYPGTEITDGKLIEIGFGVVIGVRACLDPGRANQIILGDRVRIEREVRIACTGEGGRICLGELASLDRGVDLKVHQSGQMEIGDRTFIGPYSCISGYGKIAIGKDCLIASNVAITAHNHAFSDPMRTIREQGFTVQGITIEDDCWLGSAVQVVDGVTIGKGSIVSSGAVVMKDIPPYSIAAGVPAKVIAKRKAFASTSQSIATNTHAVK